MKSPILESLRTIAETGESHQEKTIPQEVIDAYDVFNDIAYGVAPITTGHCGETYIVMVAGVDEHEISKFVVQARPISTHGSVTERCVLVTEHLAENLKDSGLVVPAVVARTNGMPSMIVDGNGWVVYDYVENIGGVPEINTEFARNLGISLAELHKALNVGNLAEKLRSEKFEYPRPVTQDVFDRLKQVNASNLNSQTKISFADGVCREYDNLFGGADFINKGEQIIIHGDPKPDNWLYVETVAGEVRTKAAIDFEEVALGTRLRDIGDKLRSIAKGLFLNGREAEIADHIDASIEGYLQVADEGVDKLNVLRAIAQISLELTARYLIDSTETEGSRHFQGLKPEECVSKAREQYGAYEIIRVLAGEESNRRAEENRAMGASALAGVAA